MAVPTITSLTPSAGLPSGRGRVNLVGTNFRLPPVPPPGGADAPLTGPVPGPWLRTVSVKINGLEADEVVPVSAAELWIITPEFRGDSKDIPDAVDVVVANLDNSGVEIPGETVTLVDGFTYRRQDLTADSDVAWVARNVLRRFRRNIIQNSHMNTHFDFSLDPASGLNALASLPSVLLEGPDMMEDDDNRETEEQLTDAGGDNLFVRTPPFTARLEWRILIVSDGKAEVLNLVNLVELDVLKRPFLVVETESGSGVFVELEVFLVGDFVATEDFGDGLHTYGNILRVQGLLLDETYGVETGGIPKADVIAYKSDDTDDVPTLQVDEGTT